MNKHLQLAVDIEVVRHPGQTVLRLMFHRESLPDWCLGLCLLSAGLISTLTITSKQQQKAVRLQLAGKPESRGLARVILKSEINQLDLTRTNLDYLQHFFLKYYRDGVADVDHIDLEAIDADAGHEKIYVTLKVPESKAPVSADEAERRLRG